MRKVFWASLCLATIAAIDASAEGDVPKGWFLHDDLAPTLTLAYYDPATGDVDVSINCTTGYGDVIVAFYPKSGDTTEKRPVKLALTHEQRSHAIDATGQTYNGRYVIDGATTMQPDLAGLLVGGFTITVDGEAMGAYAATEDDAKHVKALTDACTG